MKKTFGLPPTVSPTTPVVYVVAIVVKIRAKKGKRFKKRKGRTSIPVWHPGHT